MSYVTGTAANFAALKTAIESACTAAGWTLNTGVLSKGAAYFKFQVLTSTRDYLQLSGGTGASAGALSGANARSLVFRDNASGHTFTFPVTYYIHTFNNPDEVYISINYNTDYWQHMAFGISSRTDVGNGIWFMGTANDNGITATYNVTFSVGTTSQYLISSSGKFTPMGMNTGTGTASCAYFNGDIGSGNAWYDMGNNFQAYVFSMVGLPNALSTDEVLLPVKQCVAMASPNAAYYNVIGILKNARLLRIDNRTPAEVISVGAVNWKVYPSFSKNTASRNTVSAGFHSGTFGFAVRYDGA